MNDLREVLWIAVFVLLYILLFLVAGGVLELR